jgi:D-inositol-3-phosphate glycosyltransferase
VEGIKRFANEKGIRYELIHSHYWLSGLVAESLQTAWRIPFVHMFHTLGEMKNRIARSPEEREGEYRLDGERRVLEHAERIIAATMAEKAQLEWLYKADSRKISIIPPGVDISHFYPIPVDEAKSFIGLPLNEKMILFVGRIEPLKGVDTVIRAMAHLKFSDISKRHPVHLAIIGGDPNASPEAMNAEMLRLQQMCHDLCMDRMVVFLGKRGQDTLPYYYSAAEALVMPSHYESFGMVALEAMACGTPVIASQVGGLAFLVQNGVTGYSIPDQDPDALADSLKKLLGDSTVREEMGKRAAEYAREYSWPLISTQILDVYKEICRGEISPTAANSIM